MPFVGKKRKSLPKRGQRALFERIDLILSASGLEQDFINLALTDRKIDADAISAKLLERFARMSVLRNLVSQPGTEVTLMVPP